MTLKLLTFTTVDADGGVSTILLLPLNHYPLLGFAGIQLAVILVAASQVLTFSLFGCVVVVSSANLMMVLEPCVATRSWMWWWPSAWPDEEVHHHLTTACRSSAVQITCSWCRSSYTWPPVCPCSPSWHQTTYLAFLYSRSPDLSVPALKL